MEETQAPPTSPPAADDVAPANPKRKLVFVFMSAGFVLVGVAVAIWWWLVGRWYESTEDAYVQGDLVALTPQIPGIVVRINADETALVRAGEPVVELDRADTKTQLAHAEAVLAQTIRRVRQLFANVEALRATVTLRQAELRRAREDLARRTGLPDSGAVSEEELKHARAGVETAAAALQEAREQLAASESLVSHTTTKDHPDVAQAGAQVRAAYLAAHRTSLVAPVDGYIANRTVQVGQQIAAGTPLLAIVPLTDVWVDANFKETELAHVRIGQPATLISDLYGDDVEYRGRVVGLAPGTGAAFALLPPQNATGNWIKIVQRLPVRIELDREQLEQHPLRIGLSMNVKIDTHDRSGPTLAPAPSTTPAATTTVYDGVLSAADDLVTAIITANLDPSETQVAPQLVSK